MRTIPIPLCPARMRIPTGVKNGFYSPNDDSRCLKRSRFKGTIILIPTRLDAPKRHEILIARSELADCLKVKDGAGKVPED
jgi:hypothetical protein